MNAALAALANDESGSEVVEYALIIALISIVLALALNSTANGIAGSLADLTARVTNCLASTSGTC